MIRIGPAGWSYPDWAGVAYPEPKPKGFDPLVCVHPGRSSPGDRRIRPAARRQPARTDENREWLDDVARAFARYPLVLEVRHPSWNTAPFYEELAERGIGFVNIDQPQFHHSIKPSAAVTSPVGYVRVHGRNYQDWFRKGAGGLKPWVVRAREVAEAAAETFVVTNNHYRAKALVNALMPESMLMRRKVPAPPELAAAYPDAVEGFVRASAVRR